MPSTRWRNKYFAKKIVADGKTFDSKREYARYKVLKGLEDIGDIEELQTQVEFVLIPEQRLPGTMITKGKHAGEIKPGRIIERKCSYFADFTYKQDGEFIVEDVKSPITRTPEYIIKRKLLLWLRGLRVREVE